VGILPTNSPASKPIPRWLEEERQHAQRRQQQKDRAVVRRLLAMENSGRDLQFRVDLDFLGRDPDRDFDKMLMALARLLLPYIAQPMAEIAVEVIVAKEGGSK
jgi:hypothetical protein